MNSDQWAVASGLKTRHLFILVAILLVAFGLRTYNLTAVPPGLTHDEANHGREALGILAGELLFYFPLNYGSEPLYSYTVAGLMAAVGKNPFAMRLVNLLMSLLAMSAAYAWSARLFGRRVALWGLAITAVSFWSLASSREALRAGMLPFFMTLAVWHFWRIYAQPSAKPRSVALFGVAVAITLHIYLAARVVWFIFPLFLLYLGFVQRNKFRQVWRPTLAGLLLAGSLVVPMFVYLRYHPEALTRLDMLDTPLQALKTGQVQPIWQNATGALLAFVSPGYGDQFLAYNIPGRPVLQAGTAVFFFVGLLITLWRWRRPTYAFLLLWFGVGISPSLITGATANTTRNLAALPAVYLLPAIGFVATMAFLQRRGLARVAVRGLAIVWFAAVGVTTAHDYFVRWGESPPVRDAYMHTLITALTDLATAPPATAVAISSVYPGVAHDPSIALVVLPDEPFARRWMDARQGLIWPNGTAATAMITAATPPHPLMADWLTPQRTISLREDDLNPFYTLYTLEAPPLPATPPLANFNDGVHLLAATWDATAVAPTETAHLITLWRVVDPEKVGPKVPPLNQTNLVLFSQILLPDGNILAQRDSLEVPSWGWQAGDVFLQIHPLTIPAETANGRYQTIVGFYDPSLEVRTAVVDDNGRILETFAPVEPVTISNEQ